MKKPLFPLSYVVVPYKPTKYRCIEPPEPDSPATAAADSARTPAAVPVPDSEPTRHSARLTAGSQNVSNDPNKRKANETLQFFGKRAKTDDDAEPKLDVTV
ncbi:hypothetical protein AZE42_12212 [Rhizopogon vesiculosus]|uniref:Uncharacterized protein n=1 Tax=Rhizopogon vesiculosus TaxID=180088 RepID=A0A1J8PZK2_9AGAM|nr:hypothetical protein AZE42_12212 [Rhizopogon vesiculosus]